MANQENDHQQDIFHLLPVVAGGRALRDLKGNKYFADLARRGAAMRTPEKRKAIARKAAEASRRRLFTNPRTETTDWRVYDRVYRITERVIPWFPHQKPRGNRKRPIYVRIQTSFEELDKE